MGNSERSNRWDADTVKRLKRAGWFPNRDVGKTLKLPTGFELFSAARNALFEFGGLSFGDQLGYSKIDPLISDERAAEIRAYEKPLGRRLYPMGVVEGGDYLHLVIDEYGVVYTITDRLEPFASCFDQAIVYLSEVCAVNRDIAKQDLERIGLYGRYWEKHPSGE